ncbi:Uncharacterised protein [Acinetobacter baumannii]|nr:Uncharacterised protein [Acinetobacter baumannii]
MNLPNVAIQRISVPDEFADIARNGSDQHEQYLKHLPTKTKRYHLNGIQLISAHFLGYWFESF